MRLTGPEAINLTNAGVVIAAGVIVLRQSRELAGEILKMVEEVVRGVRGIKAATIDTGKQRVPRLQRRSPRFRALSRAVPPRRPDARLAVAIDSSRGGSGMPGKRKATAKRFGVSTVPERSASR